MRVLLIEDSPDDAELIEWALRRAGLDPDVTRVETEAEFAAAFDRVYDVIVSDYVLPTFSALEALRLLHEWAIPTPVIVCTGAVRGDSVIAACSAAGARGFVLKDDLGKLPDAIAQALHSSPGGGDLAD